MNVWIVRIGEPLPVDRTDVRLMRAGIIAEMLYNRGHEVTWWTSTFDFQQEKMRYTCDVDIHVKDHYCIKVLKSIGYKKTVSIRRMIDHVLIAKRFARIAKKQKRPDLIFCSVPTVELSYEAVKFAKKHHIPVILDLRDLWPDIFLDVMPQKIKFIACFVLASKFHQIRFACKHATALFGITKGFLQWGLQYAGREQGSRDKVFPLGYPSKYIKKISSEQARSLLIQKGVDIAADDFVISYIGRFTRMIDLASIIEAVLNIDAPLKLILAGQGYEIQQYKKMACNSKKIIFAGWLDQPQINALMHVSSLGLAPYRNTSDFMRSIPNKVIEYLSGGLPVLSSLRGAAEELILNNDSGYMYDGNVEKLKALLLKIIHNPDQLLRKSANASDLYYEHFMAEKIYDDLVRHLEFLILK